MHTTIASLYQRHATAFDRLRSRELFEREWLDRFTQPLPSGADILDVGCGTGEPIAAELIRRGAALTGIDVAPAMIEMCRARFPHQDWTIADMRQLKLGRRFDAVLAWHSLIHIHPDQQRPIFVRIAGHLKPGGMLMFTSGRHYGELIGEFEGEPLYHGSLSPDDYGAVLTANGFTLLDHRIGDQRCGGATVWLAQMRPASGLDGSA